MINLQKCKCKLTNYKELCENPHIIELDYTRDSLLNEYSKQVLDSVHMNKYPIQEMFARVARKIGINCYHASRMYYYMSCGWFVPSTPVIRYTNGVDKYPIACFVTTLTNEKGEKLISDMTSIYKESLGGGGIGINLSNIYEFQCVQDNSLNNGAISYIHAFESLFDILKPIKSRPAIFVYWISISHPDVRKVIGLRKPSFDPMTMKLSGNVHIGVIITDEFMNALENRQKWKLISRFDPNIFEEVDAVDIWRELLIARNETGGPFIFFYNNAQKAKHKTFKKLGIDVPCTNMCTEILLPNGLDNENKERTSVCCLGSVNLECFEQWNKDPEFMSLVTLFLDCVLQCYIDESVNDKFLESSRYCAIMSRPLGLGVFGFSYLLQQKGIAFESEEAIELNEKIFKYIQTETDKATIAIGEVLGHAPDNIAAGNKGRNTTLRAIAPTSYTSLVFNSSEGINPSYKMCYNKKNAAGNERQENKYLILLIRNKYKSQPEKIKQIWDEIWKNDGSIQSLPYFTEKEKRVFKTAFEIDQRAHIRLAAERQKYLDQTQSLNLFFDRSITKKEISLCHKTAHKLGVVTLYYSFGVPLISARKLFDNQENENLSNIPDCSSCVN